MYIIEKHTMFQTMLAMQLNEVSHAGNIHLAQYGIDYVFRLIDRATIKSPSIILHGYKVKPFSQRYLTFLKSTECVWCGVKGTVFCLDTKKYNQIHKRAHFNLYGIMPSGRVVMLTKDHIVPKSKGGSNYLDNYQTMCETCNQRKNDD